MISIIHINASSTISESYSYRRGALLLWPTLIMIVLESIISSTLQLPSVVIYYCSETPVAQCGPLIFRGLEGSKLQHVIFGGMILIFPFLLPCIYSCLAVPKGYEGISNEELEQLEMEQVRMGTPYVQHSIKGDKLVSAAILESILWGNKQVR